VSIVIFLDLQASVAHERRFPVGTSWQRVRCNPIKATEHNSFFAWRINITFSFFEFC